MIQSILVVCVGNICRSPAAEKLFRHKLPRHINISSAGLGAMVGYPMDENMHECFADSGINDLTHKAHQLTPDMIQAADLILAMEQAHIEQITQMLPSAHGKTMLLGKWAQNTEVADPYKHSKTFFQHIYQQIATHVDEWVNKLPKA